MNTNPCSAQSQDDHRKWLSFTLREVAQFYCARNNAIEKLVEAGVHNDKFPQQRTAHIAAMEKQANSAKQNLHPFELDLKICQLDQKLSVPDEIERLRKEVEGKLSEASASAAQVEKVLQNLQSKAAGQGVEESQTHFASLEKAHRTFERSWFAAFLASGAFTAYAVSHIYGLPVPESQLIESSFALLKSLLVLSASGVLLRICLTKYNTERKLRIVYGHRQKVLEQYRSFEAGIGDDAQAKNEFRLEIAKYIFSDPETGYDSKGAVGTEINLSPVIGAVEKIAKR